MEVKGKVMLTATMILVSTNAVSSPVHIVNVISLITIEFVLCKKYVHKRQRREVQVNKGILTSEKSLDCSSIGRHKG